MAAGNAQVAYITNIHLSKVGVESGASTRQTPTMERGHKLLNVGHGDFPIEPPHGIEFHEDILLPPSSLCRLNDK